MGTYRPHHTAISVRNVEDSIAFYQKFGFEEVHRYVEPDNSLVIVHLKLGNTFLEIFAYAENSDIPVVDYEYANNLRDIGVKHIALRVDDIQETFDELTRQGLVDPSTKITVGRTKVTYFFIKDPDGIWVEILKDDRY